MVLAVLETHAGVRLAGHDVYLNVAGGMRIAEPAADLAAAAALVSSLTGTPLPADSVFFGEIGLSGAIRPVTQFSSRIKEATKLGFSAAYGPAPSGEREERNPAAVGLAHVADLVARVAGTRRRPVAAANAG
jgi:DNA repair protein RadA/Sms